MAQKNNNVSFALGQDASNILRESLKNIADAVGSTMGPGGRPFGFDKQGTDLRRMATFSKDGLTALRALRFPGNYAAQAVLQYCSQAASHSVLASGDGTTSTIVLASAVAEAVYQAKTQWPQAFARQIEKDANLAIEMIKKEAITGEGVVRKVALTSTNGDSELTDVVLQAVSMSSAFGSILTVKNPASKVRYRIDRQDGYSYCKGYDYNIVFASSASDSASSSKAIEWKNPYVSIFNGNLILDDQVNPILQQWSKLCENNPKHLVIVCYEVSEDVTNKIMVLNRKLVKMGISCFIVKPRLTAEINSGVQIQRDIASFCGISSDNILDGGNYKACGELNFGTCDMVKITPTNTMFIGRSPKHWVEERIIQNKHIADESRSQFDCHITNIRNAELAEGLVKVEMGGGLLPELKEREDRFDDASKAAQACSRSGALPGCGLSYIRAAKIAAVHPLLEKAFRSIYETVLFNYGTNPDHDFFPSVGMGMSITQDGIKIGSAMDLDVLDAAETVYSVIQNGVALGLTIATIGGFIYRELTDEDV
jgi:chaperonin GroEL